MRNVLLSLMVMLLIFVCLAPVIANDASDVVTSPLTAVPDSTTNILAFLFDAVISPDGTAIGYVPGVGGGAWVLNLDSDTEWKTGLDEIPVVRGLFSYGVLLDVADDTITQRQRTGYIGLALTNKLGGELRLGYRLVSADFADKEVDLGWFGRIHYLPVVEYAIPLS